MSNRYNDIKEGITGLKVNKPLVKGSSAADGRVAVGGIIYMVVPHLPYSQFPEDVSQRIRGPNPRG